MESKIYKINVDGRANEYILGRISGIMDVFNENDISYAHTVEYMCGRYIWSKRKVCYTTMRVKTTKENYAKIVKLIEERYPGLCEFEVID